MNDIECGCQPDSCDILEGEPLRVLHTEIKILTNNRICIECGRTIKKGEKAEYIMSEDGRIFMDYTCIQCLAIYNEYVCNCRIIGGLEHQIWGILGVNIRTGEVALDDDEPPFENSPGCPWI